MPETKINSQESSNDTVSKLEKLAYLKEKGLLTYEEFEIEKRKILKS